MLAVRAGGQQVFATSGVPATRVDKRGFEAEFAR
jgi:hypothetical protein